MKKRKKINFFFIKKIINLLHNYLLEMGVSCPNETNALFKILPSGTVVYKYIHAEFEEKFFAQGSFRYCYRGKIKNSEGDDASTIDFPSGKCVVKVYKDGTYTQDYIIDFVGSQYAHNEAVLFNQIINIPNKLNFVLPYAGSVNILAGFKLFGLFKVSTSDESKKYLSPDMKVAIEPYLAGTYIKFSSNTGYENPDFNAYIPAFSHFTWVHSRGTRVVMDVQGIFSNKRYYLTDPACQSLDQQFGNSDLGAMGLIKFLLCHRHNDICQNWKWIPMQFEGLLKAFNANSIKRTSFSFEHSKNIQKYTPIYINLLKLINFD